MLLIRGSAKTSLEEKLMFKFPAWAALCLSTVSFAGFAANPIEHYPGFSERISGVKTSDPFKATIKALEGKNMPVYVNFQGTAPHKTALEGRCGGYEFTQSPFFNDVMSSVQGVLSDYLGEAKLPVAVGKEEEILLIRVCIDPDSIRMSKPACGPVSILYRYSLLRGSLAEAERRLGSSLTVNDCASDPRSNQNFSIVYDSNLQALQVDSSDADFAGLSRGLTAGERGNAAMHAIPQKIAQTIFLDPLLANNLVSKGGDLKKNASDGMGPTKSNLDVARKKCGDLGLKSGTEKFGECVLRLSK